MRRLLLLFVLLSVLCVQLVHAQTIQTFTLVDVGLPDYRYTYNGHAWGDYDNDGDLDLVMTGASGESNLRLYRNGGGTSFTTINVANIPAMIYGAVDWGDFDNDNDLDLLMSGSDGSIQSTRIWKNNGDGNFSQLAGTTMPGFSYGDVEWGDYDVDGDLDFFVAGRLNGNFNDRYFQIWTNNGDETFTQFTSPLLTGRLSGAWGDYDGDDDLDLVITEGNATQLWRYDDGAYVQVNVTLSNGHRPSWGDFDADGDLDLLIGGSSKVWRNDGNDTFTDFATLTASGEGNAVWGDHDNDGDLDVLLSGNAGTRIWNFNGTGFTEFATFSTQLGNEQTVLWADFDDDGDLDFIRTGKSFFNDSPTTEVWKNAATTNQPPGQPQNPAVVAYPNGDVTLSWLSSTDDHTPASGLSYNISIGTTSNGIQVRSPMAENNGGFRKIVRQGIHKTSFTINLPPGQYYWRVQAIDGAFLGSNFTGTVPFNAVLNNPPVIENQTRTIGENNLPGVPLGSPLMATDIDSGQTVTYAIESGNESGAFAIDSITGQITVSTALDYETQNSYVLGVKATDNGTPAASTTVTVTVDVFDTNERPVLSGVEAAYAVLTGDTLAFNADASDSDDPAQTLTFSLESAPLGATIDSASGEFSWTPVTAGNYSFAVRVSDGGSDDQQNVFVKVIGIQELLLNGGFESPLANSNWKPLTLTKDKRMCTAGVGYNGSLCAFMFRASATENSRLTQKVKLPLIANLNINDTLTLSAQVKAINIKSLKVIRATVRYIDGTTAPLSLNLPAAPTGDYELLTSPPLTLTKPVQSIQVMIQFRGKTGRIYVDDVSLLHVPDAVLRRAALPR